MALGLVMGTSVLPGQEQPLTVSGTFSTGYYSTYTRGEANQSVKFVPAGAKFDVSGFFLSPDLLNFSMQPELNLGPQASEAGFQGGNGIRLRMTFLRKRIFPLTFRYSNVQMEDVYFGSLSQISAYSLRNRTRDLGVTWELKPAGLPVTTIDWGTGSVDSKSDIALIPDYQSHMNHLNADSRYGRWGWNLDGFAHRQQQQSDLFAPLNVGTNTSSLEQTVTQYQGSGQRNLFRDSEFYAAGGGQSTDSRLFDLPIHLTTRFANANLRLFQKRRWKGSLRAGYSSNLASLLLAQVVTGLGNIGPGAIAPDPALLSPLVQRIANVNLNGITSVDLAHGWGLYGSADQSAIIASSQESPLNASYFTISTGVTYAGGFNWGRLSGQYGRDFGEGSVTGQSGTIQGQSYMVNVQHGQPEQLRFDMSVHGMYQRVDNVQPVNSDSFSAEGSVSRRVAGSFNARLGGGWQWGTFQNAANEFRSDGYTARVDIESPRIQINASINNSLGNSLPVSSALLAGISTGAILLTPFRTIPSDFRAMTFAVHAYPVRKLEVSAMYNRSRQHLDSFLNNDFALLNVHLIYHYRRLQLEAGYIRSNQIFVAFPETRRGRLYVRVSRTARLL